MPPAAKPPPTLVCVLINQLAFPGLGTILTGRKVSGYLQAAIMLMGFVLTTAFLVWQIICSVRYATHSNWTDADYRGAYRPYLPVLYVGLALCGFAWCWALISSIAALRDRPSK